MSKTEDQTAAELRAEVEQLRETVHDQQAQIEELEEQVSDDDSDGVITPSRRGFIEGAAATGSAGLLGLSIFGSASGADTSAGAYGAPGKSADIYLDEILDPQGDQVADLDDSGNFQFQRGLSLPSANIADIERREGFAKIWQNVTQTIEVSAGRETINFDTNRGDYTPGDALTVDLPNNSVVINDPGVFYIGGLSSLSAPNESGQFSVFISADDSILSQQRVRFTSNASNISAKAVAMPLITTTPTDISVKVNHSGSNSKSTQAFESYNHLEVVKIG